MKAHWLHQQAASDAVPVRLLTRIVLACAFQTSMVWRRAFGGDYLSAMVWPSIDLANTEYIFSHDGLFQLFLDGKFPDTLRRPISVRAIGASMGHDVETVRRSTKRLVERGLCEHLAAGMIVKSTSYDVDYIETASQQTLDLLTAMFGEFERWSITFPAIRPLVLSGCPWDQALDNAQVKRRLSVLLLLEFIFRYTIENLDVFEHNLVAADAFLCIFIENNRPFVEDDELAMKYSLLESPPPAELRRPASIRGTARRTGYPAETTRRHVNRLVEMGFVERRGEGLVIPTAVTVRPDFVKVIGNFNSSLIMMARRIQRIASEPSGAAAS